MIREIADKARPPIRASHLAMTAPSVRTVFMHLFVVREPGKPATFTYEILPVMAIVAKVFPDAVPEEHMDWDCFVTGLGFDWLVYDQYLGLITMTDMRGYIPSLYVNIACSWPPEQDDVRFPLIASRYSVDVIEKWIAQHEKHREFLAARAAEDAAPEPDGGKPGRKP